MALLWPVLEQEPELVRELVREPELVRELVRELVLVLGLVLVRVSSLWRSRPEAARQ
jgi:hypothetical protein